MVWDEPDYDPDAFKSSFGKTLFEWAYEIYGGGMLQGVSGQLSINFTSGTYATIGNTLTQIYHIIQPIGCVLLVLYFLLELAERVQAESFNLEQFIRMSCKLLIGVTIMNNGLDLLTAGMNFASGIYESIAASAASNPLNSTVLDEYYVALKDASFFKCLPYLFELLIPWLMMFLCKIVLYVMVYSRVLELLGRGVFAPIGMSNIFSGGFSSSGYRYFKKFVAVALQGAVIAVILLGMSSLQAVIYEGVSNGTIIGLGAAPLQIVIALSATMLMIKSQGWANDIMGV